MKYSYLWLLFILSVTQAQADPLHGYITNHDIHLCPQRAKHDNRGHAIKGRVEYSHIRGLIGILYDPESGVIDFIYPESDLVRLGVEVGNTILTVNKEHCLPCLLPGVSWYPAGGYLDLVIRTRFGGIRHLSVKLIPASNITGDAN